MSKTLKTRAFFIFTILSAALIACAVSPTGRKALRLVTDEEVNKMGLDAFAQIKAKTPVNADPRLNAFARCVGMSIVAVSGDDTGVASWEVVVFQDETANAFALPGGKIGVNTGIFRVIKSQEELATVLGHEVGHVIARHGNERVSESMITNKITSVVGAFGKDSPFSSIFMGALGMGAQYGIAFPHSRIQESEADEIGLGLMADAGYNPMGAVTFWTNMLAAGTPKIPKLLSDHPPTEQRLSDLQKWMVKAMVQFEQAKTAGRSASCGSL